MGSLATTNPNSYPWMPNAVFKDCSQGICSFYCPQWCSIIYPPPPPSSTSFSLSGDGDSNDSSSSSSSFQLSPLIVALIGVLASAFVLVTYYTIISRFCNRRRRIHQHHAQSNDDVVTHGGAGAVSSSTSGLDETLIRSITVRKYTKGDGIVDCSVCLSEFEESESVRLLPKCNHAFHIPCIDTWLRSHSSCPLCRSNIVSSTTNPSSDPPPPLSPSQEASAVMAQPSVNVSVSALQFHHRDDDTVIVIQGSSEREIEAGFGGNSAEERNNNAMLLQEANSCSSQQGRLLVADVLRAREDDDDDDEEIQIGSSKGK